MQKLSNEQILKIVQEKFSLLSHEEFRNLLCLDFTTTEEVVVPNIISFLRTDSRLLFSFLVDIAGVDYSKYSKAMPERFAVVYHLYSFLIDARIKIRAFVSEEKPEIQSVYSEYKGAILSEREVYDMFGIVFIGHPNLKRLLMPEDYPDFPLKKDYPLKGRGERSQFPKYNIYNKMNPEQPTSEPRSLI